MATSVLLLRVATAWPLPGLGLLVLAPGATPVLAPYPLHTALAVRVVLATGSSYSATATVEEINRADTTERALLLELPFGAVQPSVGSGIWLAAQW